MTTSKVQYMDLGIIESISSVELMNKLVSVNYHITKSCNYRCKFCFARFNQVSTNHLTLVDSKKIILLLSGYGTKKITFVGGEPTLVSFLPELVIYAKSLGLVTMVVTNGSKLTEEYLQKFKNSLDWIGISIDSSEEQISKELGRGNGDHVKKTLVNIKLIRKFGIRIKLNTVVTRKSWKEDMTWLIKQVSPERWKVFKMLEIKGENDDAHELNIEENEFEYFIKRHSELNPVIENNDNMKNSYVMIDPNGCFYNNSSGILQHGKPILDVGIEEAFNSSSFDYTKFIMRGGLYQWS